MKEFAQACADEFARLTLRKCRPNDALCRREGHKARVKSRFSKLESDKPVLTQTPIAFSDRTSLLTSETLN